MCLLARFHRLPYGLSLGGGCLDTYRAFILDENDRIIRAEVLSAASDEAALNAARPFFMDADVEIWRGSKRIARVPKGGQPPASASARPTR
jgi:hypothetical protein